MITNYIRKTCISSKQNPSVICVTLKFLLNFHWWSQHPFSAWHISSRIYFLHKLSTRIAILYIRNQKKNLICFQMSDFSERIFSHWVNVKWIFNIILRNNVKTKMKTFSFKERFTVFYYKELTAYKCWFKRRNVNI